MRGQSFLKTLLFLIPLMFLLFLPQEPAAREFLDFLLVMAAIAGIITLYILVFIQLVILAGYLIRKLQQMEHNTYFNMTGSIAGTGTFLFSMAVAFVFHEVYRHGQWTISYTILDFAPVGLILLSLLFNVKAVADNYLWALALCLLIISPLLVIYMF